MEMPGSYWQARQVTGTVTREQESSSRLGWTIAIACIVLITASQALPKWLDRHDRQDRDRPRVTLERIEEMARSADPVEAAPGADEMSAELPGAPPQAPEVTLDALVRQGVLRRATLHDLEAWRAAGGAEPSINMTEPDQQAESSGPYLFHGYVVLAEMEFPAGLYGAHRATFIVPPGVPVPGGDRGHSQVLDMNP
jgi:hypothetical protein